MRKYCPMLKIDCIEERCALYSNVWEECAIFSLGDSIANLLVVLEDDSRGANVNVKSNET